MERGLLSGPGFTCWASWDLGCLQEDPALSKIEFLQKPNALLLCVECLLQAAYRF